MRNLKRKHSRAPHQLPLAKTSDSDDESPTASESDNDSPRKVPLTHVKGRAAGDPLPTSGGAPKFYGTLSTSGLIRIDCENYPAHWQEIQLPDEVVQAWKEHRSKKVKEEVCSRRFIGWC